jgi:hypothetical protein
MSIKEGMETVAGKDVVKKVEKKVEEVVKKADEVMNKEGMTTIMNKAKKLKEGFSGANNTGSQFASNEDSGYIMKPDRKSVV